jgi:hypothetical protein
VRTPVTVLLPAQHIVPEAINNHGVIVGYGTPICRGGTVQNLNNLIPPGSGSTPGNAAAINGSGQCRPTAATPPARNARCC